MNDDELMALLTEHSQVERPLRSSERQRLKERLAAAGAPVDAPVDAEASPTAPTIDISPSASGRTARRSRSTRLAPIAAAAAILVAMAALLVLFAGPLRDNGDVSVVADVDLTPFPTPAPTAPPPPLPPSCPAPIEEFIRGVDGWDGIDRWASLIDERRPDPDLARLGAAALADWRRIAPSDAGHSQLDIVVDEDEVDPSEQRSNFVARRAAPIQELFDALRVASAQPQNRLEPCATQIETTAAELGLAPIGEPGP